MEGSKFVRPILALPMDAGADPQMWLWSAERLFYGGQTLWALAGKHWRTPIAGAHPAEAAQFGVALLLFGYAIENGLKGLVIQRRNAAGNR
jgi:hypothetical protein